MPPAKPSKKQSVALRYVGKAPFRGAPARDLTPHDIARLAYRRAIATTGPDGVRPDPRNPDPELIQAITAELTGSGLYAPEE